MCHSSSKRLHVHLDPLDALVGRVDGLQVLFEHDLHGGMRQHQLAQVPHVRHAPRGLLAVAVAVAKQEGFELVAAAAQVLHGIGARAAEIADGFVALVGHMHGGQLAGAVQPGEHACIATVGLDLVARAFRRERGGDDIAGDAPLLQTPRQHEAAGSGLITNAQFLARMAQPAQQFFDVLQVAGDDPVAPDFSVAPRPRRWRRRCFRHGHQGPDTVLLCSSFYVVCWLLFTRFVRQRLNVAPRTCG